MKILRKYRGYDLKGPNSPYRTERAAYWTWTWLRHPISMTFGRYVNIKLSDDAWVSVLHVYGNFEVQAYSGVQLKGAQIEGDADSLRRLAALLLDRAQRAEAVQELLDAGVWPSNEDSTAFPAGFGPDVDWQDLRLGSAAVAGLKADVP
jgi:hypothetical protein